MNDYGFDYMNYLTNIPSDMMDMSNSNNYMNQMNNKNMTNKMNNTNQMNDIVHLNKMPNMSYLDEMKKKFKMNDNNQILEPTEGFIKGNLFDNLYDPYKNYKPRELNPDSERATLLYQVMQYKFALTELNLYLDTHPNDKEVLELYNKYLNIEKQMSDKYESMYGPLTLNSDNLGNTTWNWIDSPWPWEGM